MSSNPANPTAANSAGTGYQDTVISSFNSPLTLFILSSPWPDQISMEDISARKIDFSL
jgi:hypothetical protein